MLTVIVWYKDGGVIYNCAKLAFNTGIENIVCEEKSIPLSIESQPNINNIRPLQNSFGIFSVNIM